VGLLDGKVAFVSGAGPGLSRTVAVTLATEGASVVVGDVDPAQVSATVGAAGTAAGSGSGDRVVGQACDITERAQCEELVSRAVDTFGRLDGLVNIAYDGGDFLTFEAADLRTWKRTMEVNNFGTLTLTQAALPALKAAASSSDGRGGSSVVMVNTHGSGMIQPGFGAYTGSKAALAHLTKMLAAELGTDGVRVNGVHPGPIWGQALEAYLRGEAERAGVEAEAVFADFAAKTALKRTVRPEEIADVIAFLVSDRSSAVTGQAVYVNNGEFMY
jgi:NAD(P)-dependent dehydrogenase (short-subunit alcohol dehydrogenase family)